VSTRHYQAHWHHFYCHVLYEQSLATDPASTADKTSPVPDLYTIHFVVWFGDVDTPAGGSTEVGGLSHALPTYDPRDTLAWLCQKHSRSCRPDQPFLCLGCHRQETKLAVWPCGETWWPHAHCHRSQQQELATTLALVGGDSQDARAIHGSSRSVMVHPSAFVLNGLRLVVVATPGWRNGPLLSMWSDDDDTFSDVHEQGWRTLRTFHLIHSSGHHLASEQLFKYW